MNRLLLCFLFFIFTIVGSAQNNLSPKTIQVLASSELSITGDTNIRAFECVFNTIYLEECKNVEYKKNGSDIIFNNAVLSLKNKGFDCGNRAINNDFHTLLKTQEYPVITLELIKLILENENLGHAQIQISIAGTKKNYTLPIRIVSSPVEHFIGKLKLDLRDFNLEAPKKMFGLIVIDDEIEVDFNLFARL